MDESNTTKGGFSPKNFFLQIGAMLSLYTTIILFLMLAYAVINIVFADPLAFYRNDTRAMRFAIAGLFVTTPIYVILSSVLGNSYRKNTELVHSLTKKWISYLTLFLAGGVLAGDLFAVIYRFLEGDTTAAFLLKALAVFVVLGAVFMYYIQDIKRSDYTDKKMSKTYAVVSVAIIAVFIAVGFGYTGSPQNIRKENRDMERISDISQIQYSLTNYWQSKGELPKNLADVEDPLLGTVVPKDPLGNEYVYTKTGDKTFTICATFETEYGSDDQNTSTAYNRYPGSEEFFKHGIGETCFDREVDEDIFPVKLRD